MKRLKCITTGISFLLVVNTLLLLFSCSNSKGEQNNPVPERDHPRIVNIINFIRLLEPRSEAITEEVLYQTVVSQIKILREYDLGGTFLLQYDALIDSRYQKLLKSLPVDSFEIGAWWEIPQPLVENAGFKWRGRYPWDWHADVGFATGYSPPEREKLVDVYMDDFKEIFGYYPKSVGSWFIDAHTLNYMYLKYGIVASCNCKDQIGTDGYTLWGGYWNQAYYPSLVNAYMPAQHEDKQIPVPVFRMLGSDPVRQYDLGLGTRRQSVISLEPVYRFGGGDSAWVHWYFDQFIEGESLEFGYVQAGQENSFTWERMSKGFEIQIPLIARLRDENKLKVETLAESGRWFREHYKTTPATSVTINQDIEGSDLRTVWFNSRFYRANLLWENGTLRFRDIHLFDEDFPSDYLKERGTSNQCSFYTLPFVDGFSWSSRDITAGLRFMAVVDGNEVLIEGLDPVITEAQPGQLQISWPLKSIEGTLILELNERKMSIKLEGNNSVKWFMDLTTADNKELPFININRLSIECNFKGMEYSVGVTNGFCSQPGNGAIYRISPEKRNLIVNFVPVNE
jgi:hypothetical protein